MQDEKANTNPNQVNKPSIQAEITLCEFQLWEYERLHCSAQQIEDLKATIAALKKLLAN
jgi:hypothetical protein